MNEKLHTMVLSDLHLSDAEPVNPKRPLWKKFRRKEYFIDKSFSDFLLFMEEKTNKEPVELILNGDIFDFDSVMAMPDDSKFSISSHEKVHGLNSTQEKSVYKIKRILNDHDVWTSALATFLEKGHRIIFITGNHDVELYWPGVQDQIRTSLKLSKEADERLVFCEWFYVSEQDTLIEHGNQYDPYCLSG